MLENYYLLMLGIQIIHSIEEITNDFHTKFPLIKMKRFTFIVLEILFAAFWILIYLSDALPYRDNIMAFFILLMFVNGVWHMVWWGIVKKYVPGLVTAPLFVVTFFVFYFKIISSFF